MSGSYNEGAIAIKGFALNEKGDVVITNNEIQMVHDSELIRQTVQTVLSTNKGEWSLNVEEGIDFYNILGKTKIKLKSSNQTKLENENAYLRDRLSEYDKNSSEANDLLEKRLDGEG